MRSALLFLLLLLVAAPSAPAWARHRHRARAPRSVPIEPAAVGYAPASVDAGSLFGLGALPAVAGSLLPASPFGGSDGGRPIPPAAARYMGYPYNVPSYRYEGGDACLLRVGGPFGPGPSAGPCPLGFDRLR